MKNMSKYVVAMAIVIVSSSSMAFDGGHGFYLALVDQGADQAKVAVVTPPKTPTEQEKIKPVPEAKIPEPRQDGVITAALKF